MASYESRSLFYEPPRESSASHCWARPAQSAPTFNAHRAPPPSSRITHHVSRPVPCLAEIPVAPSVKAHSIIAVQGDGDYQKGRDGVVAYQSVHVDYVESEFIVRSYHTSLNQPATIEEVRRILHEHLNQSVK
jgi:hypothetical protein